MIASEGDALHNRRATAASRREGERRTFRQICPGIRKLACGKKHQRTRVAQPVPGLSLESQDHAVRRSPVLDIADDHGAYARTHG
ncbi:hypothetical protein AB0L49_06685 [Streptomyces antimycoticus]|uniref:hypothetical protein n=1 Tax=Streptomyces antimycoticus TaxID=68175 RepID=UPI003412627B